MAVGAVNTLPSAESGKTPPTDKQGDLAPEKSVDAGQLLTTNQGLKVADNQNTLKAGVRGARAAGGHDPPREDDRVRP
jgi:catalase